jgi:hypothetical protein
MNPYALGGLFVAIGLFAIAGGVMDWEWFMNSRRAWLFVKLFGRNGARVFYVLLGAGIAVVGVLVMLGVLRT